MIKKSFNKECFKPDPLINVKNDVSDAKTWATTTTTTTTTSFWITSSPKKIQVLILETFQPLKLALRVSSLRFLVIDES